VNRLLVRGRQQGAVTIFVCMMMLLMITVLVLTGYSLSTMNLQSINNAQVRAEATAAANEVIERIVSGSFTTSPASFADTYTVDINNDAVVDYQVQLAVPICVRATPVAATSASSVTLPGMSVASAWNTVWELDATATQAVTGASVRVLHGVRVLLTTAEKATVCA
jgi:hypothetical protein